MKRIPRNPFLTMGAWRILKWLADNDGEEMAYSPGGGWWMDTTRVKASDGKLLLQLCAIREEKGNPLYYYTLNEEGRKLLEDIQYVPLIVEALRTQKEAER